MENMNAENVPEEGFVPEGYIDQEGNFVPVPPSLDAYEQRPLTPIEEEILHYADETTQALAQNAWANQLRRSFASPPPMSRIEIAPNPHLPVMEFPRSPLAPGPRSVDEEDKEALRQAIKAGIENFGVALRELTVVIGPAWREMVEELEKLEKTFEGMKVVMRDFPDERDIHPGDLRDERGIRQPSHTPPFWAATPGRTSKKRGKR